MKGIGIVLLSILSFAYGYNILVMLPVPQYSHTMSYMPIFTELAKRGHRVTMVSPYKLKEPVENFREIVVDELLSTSYGYHNNIERFTGFLQKVVGIWNYCSVLIDHVLNEPQMKAFLNETSSEFDLVITETFFCQEPLMAFGHKYGAIQVSIQTVTLPVSVAHLTGNPHYPSYVPSFKFPLSQHMNFWERSINTFTNLVEHVVHQTGWIYMDYVMKKHFTYPGFEDLPPLSDLLKNISLVLVDNHVSLSYPRPYLPNVVEFGGLTVKEGPKLPANLEKFMNEAKDGVIYFSWGSHYGTKYMKPNAVAAFMSAFGKLKQRVIMKADQETLPGKPDNVLLGKWFPQASILAHPNLRVFISHGGLHGITEALYHGVPILGTPLFADQDFNINLAVEAGCSINIDVDTITEEVVSEGINKILTDPSYRENALKKSKIIRDRPVSALDNAVYWLEYVLRHKGAPHLRSAAVDLPWYQLMLLDVVTFWGMVLAVTFYLLKKLLVSTYKKILGEPLRKKKID